MTRFELWMVGSILLIGLGATSLCWVASAQADETDSAIRAALPVRQAVKAWRADQGDQCPTVSLLVRERYLDAAVVRDDPWGNRYLVWCDGTASVVSAGPDRELETRDDLILPVKD